MNKYIAVCGLNCEDCEARLATINNDNNLRKKVAEEWTKLNNVLITPEMINCVGCNIDGVKSPYCDSLCPIRMCALKNKYLTCKECNNKVNCNKIKMITDTNKEAKERIID